MNANTHRSRVALLITNITFSDARLNRHGAEKDEESMENLLRALGYEVVKHRNLTAQVICKKNKKQNSLCNLSFSDTVTD